MPAAHTVGRIRIDIDGVSDLLKRLKDFGPNLAKRELRKGVSAAGQIILRVARLRAPVGLGLKPDGHTSREHLKDTIIKKEKWYRISNSYVSVIGPRHRAAPHGVLIHGGTKRHIIKVAAGRVIAYPNRNFLLNENAQNTSGFFAIGPAVLHHPGTKPNPYLKNAFEQSRTVAMTALRHKIAAGIKRLSQVPV